MIAPFSLEQPLLLVSKNGTAGILITITFTYPLKRTNRFAAFKTGENMFLIAMSKPPTVLSHYNDFAYMTV